MRISNNKIVITGATSGIGEALLQQFLEKDNQIIAVGRNAEKLEKLGLLDSRIIPFQCDIGKQEELDNLVLFIENNHSDTNILINNAGIQYNYHFAEESQALAKIEHEVNINLIAPIKLLTLLLPTLQGNDNAAIVNVTSGLGLVPKMAAPVYCGTKAGLHIFTKALRYQLEAIKVFEIIPPLVATAMTEGRGKGKISPMQLAEEFLRAFKNNRYEVNIGKVKLLKAVNRLSPRVADNIMKGGL